MEFKIENNEQVLLTVTVKPVDVTSQNESHHIKLEGTQKGAFLTAFQNLNNPK